MSFSVLDMVFLGLMGLFMIRCYLKGFISELLSMAAVVLGLLTSLFFYKNGAVFIRAKYLPDLKVIPEILAFIALFIIVFIIIKLLEILLKSVIEGVRLQGADHFIGIVFGFLEALAVISLILFLLRIQPIFDPSPLLSDSFFAKILLPMITGKSTGSASGV
ncbi:MAG: CvpA family protein [Treponema sp.]|nr:CvpA family protein [Treponema sp.]